MSAALIDVAYSVKKMVMPMERLSAEVERTGGGSTWRGRNVLLSGVESKQGCASVEGDCWIRGVRGEHLYTLTGRAVTTYRSCEDVGCMLGSWSPAAVNTLAHTFSKENS